jgi:hypothetical protein
VNQFHRRLCALQNNWRAFKSSITVVREYEAPTGGLLVSADVKADLEDHGVKGLLGYAKDYIKVRHPCPTSYAYGTHQDGVCLVRTVERCRCH